MKKITVLLFAICVALISCDKSSGSAKGTTQPSGRIVYVNTDTLLNNYEYYKDVVKEFENKRFALENDLQKRSQSFQNEVAMFQRRAQAGGMSEDQAKGTQQQLQKKEQDIMLFRDNAAANLQTEQTKKTDQLMTNIQDYLKKFNKSDKYDLVIGYSKGGGVLYAKEDLDITMDVLKGLNEEYKNLGKPAVVDSTAKK
jgi:outer membrane protein